MPSAAAGVALPTMRPGEHYVAFRRSGNRWLPMAPKHLDDGLLDITGRRQGGQ